ncbi:MAG: type II 3-dehydroquinate dehydratase [Pseudomonadota bacterium]
MTLSLYCLNGPNLNLLGTREPEIYGSHTLADLQNIAETTAARVDANVTFRQTNHEGELIDWVQEAGRDADALILNAAAFSHTSIALHDALKALTIPIIEVHLSNPAAREAFRSVNYVTPVAKGIIAGLGAAGYDLGVEAAARFAREGSKN